MKLTPDDPEMFTFWLRSLEHQPTIWAYYGEFRGRVLEDENVLSTPVVTESSDGSIYIVFHQSKYLNRRVIGQLNYHVSDGSFQPELILECNILAHSKISFVESLEWGEALIGLVEVANIVCERLKVKIASDRQLQ